MLQDSLESLEDLANKTSTKPKVACYGHSGGRRRMWTLWSCRERSLFGLRQGRKIVQDQAVELRKRRDLFLKAIIKDGFKGELQEDLEKDAVKKKRFNVFDLARLSDLDSKFNSEALGSIAHCETGF